MSQTTTRTHDVPPVDDGRLDDAALLAHALRPLFFGEKPDPRCDVCAELLRRLRLDGCT